MARPPHIVCYAPYTNWSIHSARQVTILHALRMRGCSVSYVACDGAFTDCDMLQVSNGAPIERAANACLMCQSSVAARLAAWGMPYRWLGRWMMTADQAEASRWVMGLKPEEYATARYKDWDIGPWVRSSVHTHFRHNVLDLNDPQVRGVFGSYLYSGLLAAFALSRLFDEEKPDAQLLFNGRQSSTRIALELAKQRGIRTLCEERSYVNGRLTLFDNANCLDLEGVDKLWADWKDQPLTASEISELGGILDERWRGRSTDVSAFSSGLQPADELTQRLGLDRTRSLWVLFTSSLDESIDEPRSAGSFPSQAEWIDATIAYVSAHPEIQLVIRVHPNVGSTKSLGRNPQDATYFGALAARLPANVKLVPSDDPASSYTLAAIADLGLVWYSTIGLEMAAMGRPVLRAGASWLAKCDFFIPVPGPTAYAGILDQARQGMPADRLQAMTVGAWRFAYIWYFRQSLAFPLVKQPKWYQGEPDYPSLEALNPGKDPSLDHICDVFMRKTPLYDTVERRDPGLYATESAEIGRLTAPYSA